jgi:hypothetical protein
MEDSPSGGCVWIAIGCLCSGIGLILSVLFLLIQFNPPLWW